MGPTGNDTGGFRFLTLRTNRTVTRYSGQWTELPMPQEVIERVEYLGRDQPEDLIFKDRHGNIIGDVELPGVDGHVEPTIEQHVQNVDVNPLAGRDDLNNNEKNYSSWMNWNRIFHQLAMSRH